LQDPEIEEMFQFNNEDSRPNLNLTSGRVTNLETIDEEEDVQSQCNVKNSLAFS
jgi:hypothetical protein